MRPNHGCFWIKYPENMGGVHGQSGFLNTHLPPSPPRRASCSAVQNLWVFEKLKILQHTDEFRGRLFVPRTCSLRRKKTEVLTRW